MVAKTCAYKKSDMTPCVITDGEICFAFGQGDEPICVGCERGYKTIGVPRPKDWDSIIAAARRGASPRKDKR